jgi:hypothetical protein
MIITARAAPMPIPAFAPTERGEEMDATGVFIEDILLVVVELVPGTIALEEEAVVESAGTVTTVCEVGVFDTVATIFSM